MLGQRVGEGHSAELAQEVVDPSTSVNRKVTVPVGRSDLTPVIIRRRRVASSRHPPLGRCSGGGALPPRSVTPEASPTTAPRTHAHATATHPSSNLSRWGQEPQRRREYTRPSQRLSDQNVCSGGELAVVVWPVTEAPPKSSSCSELETVASGTGHTVPAQVRARLAEAAAASLDDISTALLGEVSVGCLVGEPRLADRLHLQAEALSSQPGATSRPRGHTRSRRLLRRMRVPARAAARPPDGVRQQLPPGRLVSEPRRRRSAHQCPRGSPQLDSSPDAIARAA